MLAWFSLRSRKLFSLSLAIFFRHEWGNLTQTLIFHQSKEEGKGQESIQSCTLPDRGHHMGK